MIFARIPPLNIGYDDLPIGIGSGKIPSALMLAAQTSQIVWDPTGGGNARTFDDVMRFVNQSPGAMSVVVKGFCSVPSALGPVEMKSARFAGISLGDVSSNVVDIGDGTQLRNLLGVEDSMTLQGNSTGVLSAWDNDPVSPGTPPIYFVGLAAQIRTNSGAGPLIDVADGVFAAVVTPFESDVNVGGGGPVVRLGNGAAIIVFTAQGSVYSADWAAGPVTALVAYNQDGSLIAPMLAGFTGTTFNAAIGRVGGSGPTAFRPVPLFGSIPDGCMYVDTTLAPQIPIWWNETAGFWTDAAGAGPV